MEIHEIPDSALVDRTVLVIWHSGSTPEVLQPLVERLRARAGENGRVTLENVDRLENFPQPESSVDVILSGCLPPPSLSHSSSVLAELARLLKPSGSLFLREPVATTGSIAGLRSVKKLTSALKLAGFVDLSEVEIAEGLTSDLKEGLRAGGVSVSDEEVAKVSLACVMAKKPDYEVGASSQLSFSKSLSSNKVSSETVKVWSLNAMDDDIGLIDSDTLLEEEDLLKPDPEALRSKCGPDSGRKKACKDCTCGMREQLESGKEVAPRPITSSCGSCYLGDAFRCASCPYLGMPAFKPGDQIRLSNRQLKADQ
jgi:hypothetical protein